MNIAQRLFWPIVAATGVLYLIMAIWSLPRLSEVAGGRKAFDLRPFGYTVGEAQELVQALGAPGREFYIGTQHLLDSAFPALLAATFVLAFYRLLSHRWAFLLSIVAVAGALFDYAENFLVRTILNLGPDKFEAALVVWASLFTQVKFLAIAAAFIALLLLTLVRILRRWQSG